MKLFLIIAASAVVGMVRAACPNQCSGHGRCTNYEAQYSSGMEQESKIPSSYQATFGYDTTAEKKDSCTCFTKNGFDGSLVYAWTGADCSQKTCPYGAAFALAPGANNDHTSIIECSGKGLCDRKSGFCKCTAGYTGQNCARLKCPNDCSGRGQCKTLKQIAIDVANENTNFLYTTANVQYATAWDAETSRACVCDQNYLGPDCSILQCPSDSDPMGGNGMEYGRSCSGRGKCNAGMCKCHTGFFGTKCENQRANVA